MNDFDPTDILAEQDRQAERNQALADAAAQEIEDLRWLMNDKRGRRFMRSLLALTGVARQPWTGNAAQTDFNCGKLNVGLKYFGDLHEHAPQLYTQMIEETTK